MTDPITPELAALRARAEAAGLRRLTEKEGVFDPGDWLTTPDLSGYSSPVHYAPSPEKWWAVDRYHTTEEAALTAYLRSLPEVPDDGALTPEAAVSPAAASRRLLLRIDGPADVIAEEGGEKFVGEYLPRMLRDERVTMVWSTPPAASPTVDPPACPSGCVWCACPPPDDDRSRTRETVERLTRERDAARADAQRLRDRLWDEMIAVGIDTAGMEDEPRFHELASLLASGRDATASVARLTRERDAARAELAQRRRDDDLGEAIDTLRRENSRLVEDLFRANRRIGALSAALREML